MDEYDAEPNNFLGILLNEAGGAASSCITAMMEREETMQQQQQEYYLQTPGSTLVIRQLPSEGLAFQVWPAASTLVSLLDNYHQQGQLSPLFPILSNHGPRPLGILELGSGTGLVGIAAAAILRGARVTLTDLPHVLPNLQFNVEANSKAATSSVVQVRRLRWGEPDHVVSLLEEEEDNGGLDLVLASDVVYHQHLFDPLLCTVSHLLVPGGKVGLIMAHLRRWSKDSVFFNKARKLFNVTIIHKDPPLPGARTGVCVYHFTHKPCKPNDHLPSSLP